MRLATTAQLLILILTAVSTRTIAAPPNVVLIISDDQAWTDYSFMGHAHIQTPSIDRLAKESLTFTRAYVPSSLCRPSLATIISGLYPHQHRIVGNDPSIIAGTSGAKARQHPEYKALRHALINHVDNLRTLPRLLAPQNFVSHQSGKWWEGNFRRGGFTAGMTRGFPEPRGRHGDDGLTIGREGLEPIFDFIQTARQNEQPFFVWYAPFLPHTPHNPPQRLLDIYRDKVDSLPIAKYWAMCHWFDETCGQLLDHLDEHQLRENTMVLYVTDNGWINRADRSAYAPRSKRSPNEGGIRTPIMVRYPPSVEPKRDDQTLVSSIDLAPTILAACGLQPTEAMPGVNLLDSDALQAREQIFGEIFAHDVVDVNRPATSLRYRWTIEKNWKLIVPQPQRVTDKPVQLYDLSKDPHELNNLAQSEASRVANLRETLDRWWNGQ